MTLNTQKKWLNTELPFYKPVDWEGISQKLFEAGLWVKLTNNRYSGDDTNPVWGHYSKFIPGIAKRGSSSVPNCYYVEWMNGRSNIYSSKSGGVELSDFDDTRPLTQKEYEEYVKNSPEAALTISKTLSFLKKTNIL